MALTVSFAVIVKLYVPVIVGVPVIAPLLAFRLKPVGKLPTVTVYDNGPVPPVATTVWLYPVFKTPPLRVAVLTLTTALITTV